MCGYFCIGFIDSMIVGKSLTDFTNVLSPNNLGKNDQVILNLFFKPTYKMVETLTKNGKIDTSIQNYTM